MPDADTPVIPYTAELEAPALRQTARRFLESEARRVGVPLDPPRSSYGGPPAVRRSASWPRPANW